MLKDVKENKLVINQQVGTLSREIKLYEKKKKQIGNSTMEKYVRIKDFLDGL